MVGNSVPYLRAPVGESGFAVVGAQGSGAEDVCLAIAARSGDREALASLCARYRPLIGAVASRYRALPAGVERADVEQEAAQALCELALTFDPARGIPLAAYLKAKLGWRVAHYLRQEQRRTGHLPLESIDVESIPESVANLPSPGIASHRVARALRRLSPRQRAVIAGIFWRERTAREMAIELQVSHQAVAALKRRAEAAIRRELDGREEE